MKKLRNIKPGTRKRQRREARAALERQISDLLDHKKECCVCKAPFERTMETVQTWQVVQRENRVRLTCPDCWVKISEVLENKE
mgnify:CR=1 FL=1